MMFGIDLTILAGVVGGLAINVLRAFRSPAARAVLQVTPHLIGLLRRAADDDDLRPDAEVVLTQLGERSPQKETTDADDAKAAAKSKRRTTRTRSR